MADHMKDATFRFNIDNEGHTSFVEHKHPVPIFLCEPDPFQKTSQQFHGAYIDVISIVTAQHHDECMIMITSPCAGCGSVAKDALKSPINYLHLIEPTIIIQIMPVCGSQACATKVRKQTIEKQNTGVATVKEVEKSVFLKMPCDNCNAPDAKRCAGCGQVAYCSVECQKEAWKAHKANCKRHKLKPPAQNSSLPYEVI